MRIEMMDISCHWNKMTLDDFAKMMAGDFYGACGDCPIKINDIQRTADEWQKLCLINCSPIAQAYRKNKLPYVTEEDFVDFLQRIEDQNKS